MTDTLDSSNTTVCPADGRSAEERPPSQSLALSFLRLPLFTPGECDEIVALGTRAPLQRAQAWNGQRYVTDSRMRAVSTSTHRRARETEWIFERMERGMRHAASRYGFDVTEMTEDIKFLAYGVGDHFAQWHMDVGGNHAAFRKISMSVELAKQGSYEGGCLEIFPDATDGSLSISQGSAVLFPSFRFHRVTPVTAGTRYVLVNWMSGPPFR
jgi:PKHD-type hydroxylase